MSKPSKRSQSQQTQQRLAKVLQQVGKDAQQPSNTVLSAPWACSVMLAARLAVLSALKLASGSGIGFDYGPVGLTLLRWITVNRMARLPDPDALWAQAQAQPIAPADAKPALPVFDPTAAVPIPAIPVTGASSPGGMTGTTGATPVAPQPAAPVAAPSVAPDADPFPAAPAAPVVEPVSSYLSPAEQAHPEWDWQPASKVFGVKGLKGKVAVWPLAGNDGAHARVPVADAGYVWSKDHLQWAVFAASESPAKGVWLWGNRGAGKTEFSRQFAARTGRPFFGITFTRVMEPSEFLGDMGASNGSSVWQDGTMLQALRCTIPAVILLDEISYGQSSHISGPLNEIVHPSCSFNVPRTGERIAFSKGHFFIAADNTNGTGDVTGMHPGTNVMNRATMDRFSYFRRFTYLAKAQEVALLMNRTQCDEATAVRVWGILDALRKKVDSGLLSDPPSTREAIALCCALRAGFPERDAFECAFVGKYPEESQEEMRVTFTATFNSKASE